MTDYVPRSDATPADPWRAEAPTAPLVTVPPRPIDQEAGRRVPRSAWTATAALLVVGLGVAVGCLVTVSNDVGKVFVAGLHLAPINVVAGWDSTDGYHRLASNGVPAGVTTLASKRQIQRTTEPANCA